MATAHQDGISYLTFGELWSFIRHPDEFGAFAPYLPPLDNVTAKIGEALAIRNRIAHFREPHERDLDRFLLLMRDMEAGLVRFCTRCCRGYRLRADEDDALLALLEGRWDSIGNGIEMDGPRGWLYATGGYRHNPRMNATFEIHSHPDHPDGDASGYLYSVSVSPSASSRMRIDISHVLGHMLEFSHEIVHLFVLDKRTVGVVVPGTIAPKRALKIVGRLLTTSRDAMRPYKPPLPKPFDWPEVVLWPNHPLNIFRCTGSESLIVVPTA